ncbi:hypothetical protein B0H16DRAFT_1684185 [Mycena metata]|uniref:Uncharacterized protein n=1 Tax=Mycena metata TaxID=1033252 RepID=A0AAD7K3F6_9AGAR|nr:hypothetical protein B0H16DRAFT_1684185 [Mycena metata]
MASSRKDLFHAVAIHKIPPNLSKEECEGRVQGLMDDFVKLPVVQKRLVKLEMPVVVIVGQSESKEHLRELLADAEVLEWFEGAREFHFQDNASAFAVEVVPKAEPPVSPTGFQYMGIYNVPRQVSPADYDEKFHDHMENVTRLPLFQQTPVKYELASQHSQEMMDPHLQRPRYRRPEGLQFHFKGQSLCVRGRDQTWQLLKGLPVCICALK